MPLAGTLDASFGINGVVVSDFSGNYSMANSVIIDRNNNVIMSGTDYSNDNKILVKYSPNGNLDTSFGTNGKIVTDFSGDDRYKVSKVVIDLNDNIVVSGYKNANCALAKYDPSGHLITSFGTNGLILTDFSANSNFTGTVYEALSFAIDQNNNIVIAGYVVNSLNGNLNYALARYDPSGHLDTNFGINGKIVSNFSGNHSSQVYSIAIDKNNNIIVAGYDVYDNANSYINYALAKYDSSGNLDTNFGINGKIVDDFSGNLCFIKSVAIDQNNNIVVAGHNNFSYALAKYDSTGHLITNFGTNGKIITHFSRTDFRSAATSVIIDQNNDIIIAGYDSNNNNYALAKYDQIGHLVTNFGTNGIIVSDFYPNSVSYANSVAIDQNNNIVVAGYSFYNSEYCYGLARYYNPNTNPNTNPVSNICFVKGTPIMTDQGPIAIEKINPEKHTIRNKSIVGITNTVYSSNKYLICFEKDSLGKNIPSQKTIASENHKIFYKGQMIKAKEFVGFLKGVSTIDYKGEVLYNVLMEEYEKMVVNNIICETLDPKANIAKLYKMCQGLSIKEQNKLIESYNHWFTEQNSKNVRK